MDRPDNYINLDDFAPLRRPTLRAAVEAILVRLYDQSYTSAQVTRVMMVDPRWRGHTNLNMNVRGELSRMSKAGQIRAVNLGGPGQATLYANLLEKEMLKLTRSPKQGKNVLLIGDNIRIIIREVVGHDQVKIGIEAPADIQILREEVKDDGRNR